ncbi:protein NEOXANTHIN-DEFICIENT 1 isoform X3 [Elaeis guineensis]|uniref:Protein NEOXANTHIN-DEFICIENT 1 isoform X3 n=1 Tax=Elaeis guineensis var. tenera TaxID=51953 RepID=A0A6I9RCA3_ELAGV|nr:protein NEOXANTHIN-DEFICIENT 1 isoform X3 [Elaeis guineensis]
MEAAERSSSSSSGYTLGPPWLFKGSALYQLHLVKAETARAFIPKELKLVEAFGYTLGGLFLAHYDDSPAGRFDELVVIAGIVWNPPTSCAWAARVLVNSCEACRHGRKEIGLPSHVAVFSKITNNKYIQYGRSIHSPSARIFVHLLMQRKVEIMEKQSSRHSSFLNMIGMSSAYCKSKEHSEIQVSEIKGSSQMSICSISLPFVVPKSKTSEKWMGPMIRMSLPSFSGQTEHNPQLLKYSCQIECRSALTGASSGGC